MILQILSHFVETFAFVIVEAFGFLRDRQESARQVDCEELGVFSVFFPVGVQHFLGHVGRQSAPTMSRVGNWHPVLYCHAGDGLELRPSGSIVKPQGTDALPGPASPDSGQTSQITIDVSTEAWERLPFDLY